MKIQARTVAQALEQLNPDRKRDYQRNFGALENKLDQLDQTLRQTLAALRGRAFLVFHPAWGYFADEYGLRQIPVEWEGKQPSDQQLTQLQRLVRQEKIGQLFVQPQISSHPAKRLARAIDVHVHELDPLAPDVAANLKRAAKAIAESCRILDGRSEKPFK